MYMAKRVFKNKRLMRNLLILAGFLIVGFFLWTTLFKRGSIFEGQTTQGQVDVNLVSNEKCAGMRFTDLRPCLSKALGITEAEFNTATQRAQNQDTLDQTRLQNELQTYMNDKAQPTAQPSTTVDPNADPVVAALLSCYNTDPNNIIKCLATKLNIGEGEINTLFEKCASKPTGAEECVFEGLNALYATKQGPAR